MEGILTKLSQKHLDDFETFWKARLQCSTQEDQFWNWELKNRVYLSEAIYEGYAIECEGITQGLMLLATGGHRSRFEPDRRIVYVHSLATAPWNRPSLQAPITYRLVGSVMLRFAQYRSEELGYGGLVGLHALQEAEAFYQRMNMINCGADEAKENLTYFEWYKRRESVFDELGHLEPGFTHCWRSRNGVQTRRGRTEGISPD
ncbi:GNAT family N-acetyltransferase [Kovacikia minuta CCNUW1]|uniref:GNAT family N-acetyltransferase n=1 Tax=Kovacikia minuta TaxID=2931930 RepID=UPI001CCEE762|nr:GNAT family N-acetyltransferase [Kovacikia minuta]UBF27475.1 GNAT family N-acetyltransferase [Kovacikia minuta CCNUW1]